MKKENLLRLIDSDEFIRNLKMFSDKFKASKGYGIWLAEYKRMDQQGLFTPEKLKEHYLKILKDISPLQYIYWEAIHYIGAQALNATKEYFDNRYYEIRLITGEIAEDDNGEELLYLGYFEAVDICKRMNDDAEENLFVVYCSN